MSSKSRKREQRDETEESATSSDDDFDPNDPNCDDISDARTRRRRGKGSRHTDRKTQPAAAPPAGQAPPPMQAPPADAAAAELQAQREQFEAEARRQLDELKAREQQLEAEKKRLADEHREREHKLAAEHKRMADEQRAREQKRDEPHCFCCGESLSVVAFVTCVACPNISLCLGECLSRFRVNKARCTFLPTGHLTNGPLLVSMCCPQTCGTDWCLNFSGGLTFPGTSDAVKEAVWRKEAKAECPGQCGFEGHPADVTRHWMRGCSRTRFYVTCPLGCAHKVLVPLDATGARNRASVEQALRTHLTSASECTATVICPLDDKCGRVRVCDLAQHRAQHHRDREIGGMLARAHALALQVEPTDVKMIETINAHLTRMLGELDTQRRGLVNPLQRATMAMEIRETLADLPRHQAVEAREVAIRLGRPLPAAVGAPLLPLAGPLGMVAPHGPPAGWQPPQQPAQNQAHQVWAAVAQPQLQGQGQVQVQVQPPGPNQLQAAAQPAAQQPQQDIVVPFAPDYEMDDAFGMDWG